MESIDRWLTNIHSLCHQLSLKHVDVIIDQAAWGFSLTTALKELSPRPEWRSLWQGLPEEIYLSDAPLLIRLSLDEAQQMAWLRELAGIRTDTAALLLSVSAWPFLNLAAWLTQCADAASDTQEGLFRFWDTRLFPFLFSHILHPPQQQLLLRPVYFWSWLDRDLRPAVLAGEGTFLTSSTETCPKIVLTDQQIERLMCVCDAMQFVSRRAPDQTQFTGAQQLFTLCFEGMLAATDNGLLLDEERENWVYEMLQRKIQQQNKRVSGAEFSPCEIGNVV